MKIGLVPVAAKPYHAGHHALVEMASGANDEVLLYVSLSDRKRKGEFPISGGDMKRVWEEEIEKVLPGNVTPVYGGNPVRSVFEVLQSAEEKIVEGTPMEHTYTVYSDPVDTAQNYTQASRQKYFPTLAEQGLVQFAAEVNPGAFTRGVGTPDMSGTTMRKALQSCDIELFRAGLPKGVNAENVYNILCKENVLRSYIKAIISG
jgi:hypothetical protein